MMRHLSVYQRFGLIIAVLTIVFAAALFAQVMVLRDTVFSERRTKVFDMVQAATKVLAAYDEKAKAGKLSPEDARRLAFDAIGAMRWGASDDYLGVYGAGSTNAGVTYVHANPKYINVNRWDFRDSKGQLLIQGIVGKARNGGGFLEYQVPKATGGPELPKLTYAGGYGQGDQMLAIQAGVRRCRRRGVRPGDLDRPGRIRRLAYCRIGRIRPWSRPGSSARPDMWRHG
jgi:methyl-accepting chemotaxis protein